MIYLRGCVCDQSWKMIDTRSKKLFIRSSEFLGCYVVVLCWELDVWVIAGRRFKFGCVALDLVVVEYEWI